MYKQLESSESKNIITGMLISSAMVQFTFLVFPLSMYLVYNKVIANQNYNTIMVIMGFLIFVLIIQLILKKYSATQQHILQADTDIHEQKKYLEHRFKYSSDEDYDSTCFESISSDSSAKIQSNIVLTYKFVILCYFILISVIGKYIVLVPLLFFSLGYYIANTISRQTAYYKKEYNLVYKRKADLIKEMLSKVRVIKGFDTDERLFDCCKKLVNKSNLLKCSSIYSANLLLKFSMVINIVNIACILLLGRYLFGIGVIGTGDIITCSILTIWVVRPLGMVLTNINPAMNDVLEKQEEYEIRQDSIETINYENKFDNDKLYYYTEILAILEKNNLAYFNNNSHIEINTLVEKAKEKYHNVYTVKSEVGIFYGTILENITLFDESKYIEAKKLIHEFSLDKLMLNLPYNYNYVTTGPYDEALPFDLKIAISVIRGLILQPDVLIMEIDINRIRNKLLKSILNYAEINNIKLLCNKSSISVNKLISELSDLKTTTM